jgi:hypothetical protein
VNQKWRVGRKVGRTVYVQLGEEPSDRDILIGLMDTPEIAELAVRGVNTLLSEMEPSTGGAVVLPRGVDI